jgi:hypothetical protein
MPSRTTKQTRLDCRDARSTSGVGQQETHAAQQIRRPKIILKIDIWHAYVDGFCLFERRVRLGASHGTLAAAVGLISVFTKGCAGVNTAATTANSINALASLVCINAIPSDR